MWISAKIIPKRKLTATSVEVEVLARHGLPQALPGQFCALEIVRDGEPMKAAFSIVGISKQGHWILGVKQARRGGVSEWIQKLDEATSVSVAGPFGEFGVNDAARHHLLIAGGSGITPVWAIAKALIQKGIHPVLIFGNDSPAEVMFGEDIRSAAEAGELKVIHVFDRQFEPAMNSELHADSAVYICGPQAMTQFIEGLLSHHPKHLVLKESYGKTLGQGKSSRLRWKPRWGKERVHPIGAGETLLKASERAQLKWDQACGLGACGSCTMLLKAGKVECRGKHLVPGDHVLTCIAQPLTEEVTISPPKRWKRPEVVAASLVVAFLSVGIWAVPPGMGFRAMGPMNTGHESLACGDCHRPAEGTVRQQLSHNARSFMGWHDKNWVDVGYAPVGNDACLGCHDRPNDRHPTSRFEELRFAQQRADLGVHECNSCHGEHHDKRIASVENGFCQNCHADIQIDNDPIDVAHADLASNGEWNTCLTCHDFHGNHQHTAPTRMADRLSETAIEAYFEGGEDPYRGGKRYKAIKQ